MPTPVNNLLPPVPHSTKPAATPSGEAARPEEFQKQLQRRRRNDASEATHDAAKRAEPKRVTKTRQPKRPSRARGEEGSVAEEPEIRAAPAGEAKAEARAAAEEAPAAAAPAEVVEDAVPDQAEAQDAEGHAPVATVAPVLPRVENAAAASDDAPPVDESSDRDPVVPAARRENAKVVYPIGELPASADPAGDAAAADQPIEAVPPAGAETLFEDTATEAEPEAAATTVVRHSAAAPAAPTEAGGDPAGIKQVAAQGHATQPPPQASTTSPDAAAALPTGSVDHRPAQHAPLATPAAPPPPEMRFAAANHETIVTSMRAEVLPNGGSMRIRLDPPQLGALQVTVQIQDGLVTAAFETSTDEAARLLGHSLNQLKSVLESHGIAVDKLLVQQAPRETQTSSRNDSQHSDQRGGQSHDQEQSAHQEQQRREMLRRMWRRLTGEPDPLDLTA